MIKLSMTLSVVLIAAAATSVAIDHLANVADDVGRNETSKELEAVNALSQARAEVRATGSVSDPTRKRLAAAKSQLGNTKE